MSSDFNSIQEFRLKVEKYYRWHHDGILGRGSLEKSLFRIWKLDFALRGAVQAIEYLAHHKFLLSQSSHVRKSDIDLLAENRSIITQSHIILRRALYGAEEVLPDGPVKRAYLSLRKDPLWYLHPALTDQCARNGGCCGRSCKCCQKRGLNEGWSPGVGHCTVLCGCCLKDLGISYEDRDFKNGPEMIDSWFRPFEQGKLSKNILWQKIRKAFFFGL